MPLPTQRMAILVCAFGAMAESLIYTSLAPLLTPLDAQLGFGHMQAGLLVAGYAIGYLAGVYPAFRLDAAIGPRTTSVIGMVAVAVSSLGFADADGFLWLLGARLLAGVGSIFVYTGLLAVAGQVAGGGGRGLAIGTVFSGYAAGSAIGPLIGSLAVSWGRSPVFTALAVSQLLFAVLLTQLPKTPRTALMPRSDKPWLLGSAKVRIGLWITSVPGFALGVLTVSGSYRLHELGSGPLMVALAFSSMAVINVFVHPWIGKASDRLGRRKPLLLAFTVSTIAVGLIAAVSFQVSTVALIAIAGSSLRAVAGPGLALVGDGVKELGGDPEQGTFLTNLFWGPTAALGAICAGLVHGSVGVEISLLMLAAVTAFSFVLVRRVAH